MLQTQKYLNFTITLLHKGTNPWPRKASTWVDFNLLSRWADEEGNKGGDGGYLWGWLMLANVCVWLVSSLERWWMLAAKLMRKTVTAKL